MGIVGGVLDVGTSIERLVSLVSTKAVRPYCTFCGMASMLILPSY